MAGGKDESAWVRDDTASGPDRDVYVHASNTPTVPLGPEDRPLEKLAAVIADGLAGRNPRLDSKLDQARWVLDRLSEVAPPLTPVRLAKLLGLLRRFDTGDSRADPRPDENRDARFATYRVSKHHPALCLFLLDLDVPAEEIVAAWSFDARDAAYLVGGIIVGAANGLGLLARDMVVFLAPLTLVFGPAVGGVAMLILPLFVSLGPDFYKAKVEVKNPLATCGKVLAFLQRTDAKIFGFARSHVENFFRKFLTGRTYEAGQLIGGTLGPLLILRLGSKPLMNLSRKLTASLYEPPSHLRGKLSEAAKLPASGELPATVDGWEVFPGRDGRFIARKGNEIYGFRPDKVSLPTRAGGQPVPGAPGDKTPVRPQLPENGVPRVTQLTLLDRHTTRPELGAGGAGTGRTTEPVYFAAGQKPPKRTSRPHAPSRLPPPGDPKWDRVPIMKFYFQKLTRYVRGLVSVNSWSSDFYFGTKYETFRPELEALLSNSPKAGLSKWLLKDGKLRSDIHAGHLASSSPHYPDYIVPQKGTRNSAHGRNIETGGGQIARDRFIVLRDGSISIAADYQTALDAVLAKELDASIFANGEILELGGFL